MNDENFFKDILESIPGCRKIVLLMFLIKNDKNLLLEIGFSKNDILRSNLEFENILIGQHEEYLGYIKNKEEAIIEEILNK